MIFNFNKTTKTYLMTFLKKDASGTSKEESIEFEKGTLNSFFFRMIDDKHAEFKGAAFEGYAPISEKYFRFNLGSPKEPKGGIEKDFNFVGNKTAPFFFIGSDDDRLNRIGSFTKDHWYILPKSGFGHAFIEIKVKYDSNQIFVKYYSPID